jgi:transcriptional regulator with XRE-family HTH domain
MSVCAKSLPTKSSGVSATSAVAQQHCDHRRAVENQIPSGQDELARRADLHRTAIGLLEQGKRVARADTLIQLAGALSISPAAFFDGVYWTPDEREGGTFGFDSPIRSA